MANAKASRDVVNYIINFYNAVRLYPTMGNLSPIALQHRLVSKKPIAAVELT